MTVGCNDHDLKCLDPGDKSIFETISLHKITDLDSLLFKDMRSPGDDIGIIAK